MFTPSGAMIAVTGTPGKPPVRSPSLREPPAMAISAARDFLAPAEKPGQPDGDCLHLCPSGSAKSRRSRGRREIMCRIIEKS